MSTDKRQNPLKIKDFSVCPYYIVLADPAGERFGDHAPMKLLQHAKRDFLRQILGALRRPGLFQAEIEDFVQIFPRVVLREAFVGLRHLLSTPFTQIVSDFAVR